MIWNSILRCVAGINDTWETRINNRGVVSAPSLRLSCLSCLSSTRAPNRTDTLMRAPVIRLLFMSESDVLFGESHPSRHVNSEVKTAIFSWVYKHRPRPGISQTLRHSLLERHILHASATQLSYLGRLRYTSIMLAAHVLQLMPIG